MRTYFEQLHFLEAHVLLCGHPMHCTPCFLDFTIYDTANPTISAQILNTIISAIMLLNLPF